MTETATMAFSRANRMFMSIWREATGRLGERDRGVDGPLEVKGSAAAASGEVSGQGGCWGRKWNGMRKRE